MSHVPNPSAATPRPRLAPTQAWPQHLRDHSTDLLLARLRSSTPEERREVLEAAAALVAEDDRAATAAAETRPLVVLKFGSSVLRTPADLPDAVTEIYRAVREGARVLAVVSAFARVTDRLLAEARDLGCGHDDHHLPRYAALGEETSAAALALACDRSGLVTTSLSAAELGIVAEGETQDARCVALDRSAIDAAFAHSDVVIAPGFGARSRDGEPLLLGRGGSDLTAVFLAAELQAHRLRLIKDVDGVYERDPKTTPDAVRFSALGWDSARRLSHGLVQDGALELAKSRGLALEVAAAGREAATVVGPYMANAEEPAVSPRLRVAVAGCGVVGAGIIQLLRRRPEAFEITGVLVRDLAKPRDVDIAGLLTTKAADLLAGRPDIVVDVLSSAQAGAALSLSALLQGCDVASANKQGLIAARHALAEAAAACGGQLACSAAVGGGAPMIETVRRARAHGPIRSVEGVLNGTVNFLLGRLAAGQSFDAAMAAARLAGLAEEDASSDLEGRDAVAKLRLLAIEAFGVALDADAVICAALDGAVIAAAAAQGGAPLRQVSRLWMERGRLCASVAFESDPRFASLRGEGNMLIVTGEDGGCWTARGRGAGRWPTAESVLSDLLDLRDLRAHKAKAVPRLEA